MIQQRECLAVVGGGVAGIISAYLLSRKFDVTIYEKGSELGGHTNTFVVTEGGDRGLAVDTGFIVLNSKTYPLLHRFLDELGVQVRYSNMSFGFECEKTGLCYSGNGPLGLFAQFSNVFRPRYWKFLFEIQKFCRQAILDLNADFGDGETLGRYVERYK